AMGAMGIANMALAVCGCGGEWGVKSFVVLQVNGTKETVNSGRGGGQGYMNSGAGKIGVCLFDGEFGDLAR
ncbi:hypothetical protein Tco_1399392, partial [Tanacetum coccineum]